MPSSEYKEARERVRAAVEEARKLAEAAFKADANAMLHYLDIKSFSWTQYTPYFNDGDECLFSVHTDSPTINDKEEWDDWHWDSDTKKMVMNDGVTDAVPQETYKAVSEFLEGFDEDDMLHIFGNHTWVTVAEDGITQEDEQHD